MSEAESKLNRYKSRLSNDLSDDEATGLNSHESNIRVTHLFKLTYFKLSFRIYLSQYKSVGYVPLRLNLDIEISSKTGLYRF